MGLLWQIALHSVFAAYLVLIRPTKIKLYLLYAYYSLVALSAVFFAFRLKERFGTSDAPSVGACFAFDLLLAGCRQFRDPEWDVLSTLSGVMHSAFSGGGGIPRIVWAGWYKSGDLHASPGY